MPSSATITSFYSFTANTKARASQVNNNFGLIRGHWIPIDPNTVSSSHNTYDLGTTSKRWRNAYIGTSLDVTSTISAGSVYAATISASSTIYGQIGRFTSDIQIGDTSTNNWFSVAPTVAQYKIGGNIKFYVDGNGIDGQYIAASSIVPNAISPSVAGSGLSGGSGTALSVNVDNSTIEISGGNLQVKNAGIGQSKIGIQASAYDFTGLLNLDFSIYNGLIVRNTTGTATVYGFVNGFTGQSMTIINRNTGGFTLSHAATSTGYFYCITGANINVGANQSVNIWCGGTFAYVYGLD